MPNHICYADADECGGNRMVGDYLIGGSQFNPAFTDNAPRINGLTALMAPGDTLVLPPMFCGLRSPMAPPPDYTKIVGSGGGSALCKNYAGAASQYFFTIAVNSQIAENIYFYQGNGYTDGIAWGRTATGSADAPMRLVARNLVSTNFGNGSWYGTGKIDGLLGAYDYGSRDHVIESCTAHSFNNFGIMLNGVHGASVSNFIGVPVNDTAWGIWTIGTPDQPTMNVHIQGPCQCSVLMYGTKSSTITAGPLGRIIFDNQCVGNTIRAANLSFGPPSMAGVDNHVEADGQRWDSAA